MKYRDYQIIHYRNRSDGRIELSGTERAVLSREEALELSYSAIVMSFESIGGKPVYIHEGKHAQFDGHLGWTS